MRHNRAPAPSPAPAPAQQSNFCFCKFPLFHLKTFAICADIRWLLRTRHNVDRFQWQWSVRCHEPYSIKSHGKHLFVSTTANTSFVNKKNSEKLRSAHYFGPKTSNRILARLFATIKIKTKQNKTDEWTCFVLFLLSESEWCSVNMQCGHRSWICLTAALQFRSDKFRSGEWHSMARARLQDRLMNSFNYCWNDSSIPTYTRTLYSTYFAFFSLFFLF